jgi:hypothetical protein
MKYGILNSRVEHYIYYFTMILITEVMCCQNSQCVHIYTSMFSSVLLKGKCFVKYYSIQHDTSFHSSKNSMATDLNVPTQFSDVGYYYTHAMKIYI